MNDEIIKHLKAIMGMENEAEFRLYNAIFGGDDEFPADQNYIIALEIAVTLAEIAIMTLLESILAESMPIKGFSDN